MKKKAYVGLLALPALLCLFAGGLWGVVQRVHAAPQQVLEVTLRKTVSTDPKHRNECAPEETTFAAPGSTVYVCYTLTNAVSSTQAIDPLDLIENFTTSEFQPVVWNKPAGFLLQPGETLTPTADNGLIRPITVATSQNTAAGWGVVSADGTLQKQVVSNQATVNVVTLGMTAALGVYTTAGTAQANCSTPAVTLGSYANQAFFCVTLTNNSSVTLTRHLVSIPGFGIDKVEIGKELGAAGTTSATIRLTNADNSALAASLTAPTVSSRAYVTSTREGAGIEVSAASEPVVVSGPAASVTMLKTPNTDPASCSLNSALNNVPFGQQFYYCVVLINSSGVTFTDHLLTEPATNIAAAFKRDLGANGRITLTNNILTSAEYNLPAFLGPFEARTIVNNTMNYTASNPALGYRASTFYSAQVNIITPTPTVTRGPTATNTPIQGSTPSPTPSATPIPATPTPTWTWTPSPTFTPPPTVVVFSTPGGLAPTPYPAIPGVQPSAGNPFASPLDPFAATMTAQAQSFAFPTPIIDPFGATMTAQAQGFAFPTPIIDPFGATMTAQAQSFAFPTPILDPFGATMTAQAQAFAFPTPIVDPLGATMTAQAQFGFQTPAVDPAGAALTAQALSPLATPVPPELAPGLVITITATPTPEQAALLPGGPTQRPIEPPPPLPPGDTRSFFSQVLDTAGATLALLWFLGGSVIFFVTAGVLAGLAFRDKERARYQLEAGGDQGAFTASAPPPQADDHWPESLP
jgi:hypothetical protein